MTALVFVVDLSPRLPASRGLHYQSALGEQAKDFSARAGGVLLVQMLPWWVRTVRGVRGYGGSETSSSHVKLNQVYRLEIFILHKRKKGAQDRADVCTECTRTLCMKEDDSGDRARTH